jgi:hypothetical protein
VHLLVLTVRGESKAVHASFIPVMSWIGGCDAPARRAEGLFDGGLENTRMALVLVARWRFAGLSPRRLGPVGHGICFLFPLIAPDMRICRIRRSEKAHVFAHGRQDALLAIAPKFLHSSKNTMQRYDAKIRSFTTFAISCSPPKYFSVV